MPRASSPSSPTDAESPTRPSRTLSTVIGTSVPRARGSALVVLPPFLLYSAPDPDDGSVRPSAD